MASVHKFGGCGYEDGKSLLNNMHILYQDIKMTVECFCVSRQYYSYVTDTQCKRVSNNMYILYHDILC